MLIKIVIVCLVAVILNHAWVLFQAFRAATHPHSHAPGDCRPIPGIERGSEDMNLLKNGLILISSGLNSFSTSKITEDIKPGRLLLFDFSNPHNVEELQLPSIFDKAPLNPHGITVWQTEDSDVVTVFVINHHDNSADSIEKFHLDLSTHKLTHVETIIQAEITHINDIVAVSETSFYATLDLAFQSHYSRMTELFLQLRYGKVLFYNGSKTRTVAQSLLFPNGIATSHDGNFVYMSEFGAKIINVYQRDKQSNDLRIVQSYPVYTNPDNVIVDHQGHLWVGCHSNRLKLIEHLRNGSTPSPSQVLHLKTHNGLITSMTEVYSDDGHTLYGSTCAIYHNKQLLIGSVRHKLLLCDVNYLQ